MAVCGSRSKLIYGNNRRPETLNLHHNFRRNPAEAAQSLMAVPSLSTTKMRYIDSGGRDPEHSVAHWLQTVLTDAITEMRWQSGFYTSEGLGPFVPTLQHLASANAIVRGLIGSNDPGTQRADVLDLVRFIGLPRSNAALGVVQYGNGFFHPKTYHFRRSDGGQCAYVGSSNLTGQGIASLHIEAGIILDTNEGDSVVVLNDIANSVDSWFASGRVGMHPVTSAADVDRLVANGVLLLVPLPRQGRPKTSGEERGTPSPPQLKPLVTLPGLPPIREPTPPVVPVPLVVPVPSIVSVRRVGFPDELLFDPRAECPTVGINALSGNTLSDNAVGMIFRLTLDDSRIFAGGVGTANINLPVACIPTLRFGVLGKGKFPNRPRAEFELHVRYLGRDRILSLEDTAETNVMLYGYMPDESGHQNRRMLIPADTRQLIEKINTAKLPLPSPGHLALLEWPTTSDPEFRLSFLDPESSIGREAQRIFSGATGTSRMLADNASVLVPGVSPPW
jgi:hypothetical protein